MHKLDHILTATTATVASIPVVGGGLARLMDGYIPSMWQRSTDQFCRYLEAEVKRVEGRLDYESVNEDELADLIQQAILLSVKTTREAKHQAAAKVIANAMLAADDAEKLSYTELDHYLNAIDSLTVEALHVLAVASKIHGSQRTGDLLNLRSPGEVKFASGDLITRIEGIEPSLVMCLVSQLNNWNLLRREPVSISTIDRERGYVTNIPIYLTAPGAKFVSHLLPAAPGTG